MVAEAPPVMEAGVWWAPHRIGWWTGVLFAVGSACFVVAPFPGFVELVGSTVDGLVFFVGSIFFTAAATLQFLQSGPLEPRRIDWWSCSVQVVGTLFFNVSTFRALQAGHARVQPARLAGGRARLDLLPRLRLPRLCRGLRVATSPAPQVARVVDRGREPGRLRLLRYLGDRGPHRPGDRQRPRSRGGELHHGPRCALLPRGRDPRAPRKPGWLHGMMRFG